MTDDAVVVVVAVAVAVVVVIGIVEHSKNRFRGRFVSFGVSSNDVISSDEIISINDVIEGWNILQPRN